MRKVEQLVQDPFVGVLDPARGEHERYAFCIGRYWGGCQNCVGEGERGGRTYWRSGVCHDDLQGKGEVDE